MNEKEQNKFIAIIKDGYSDYLVIKKFISSIFEYHNSLSIDEKFFFDMGGLNIHDAMARYVNILKEKKKKNKKEEEDNKKNIYSFYSDYAVKLKNEISTVLFTALRKFDKEKGYNLNHKDALILYTDAEKVLGSKDNYFKKWAYTLNAVLCMAIDEFYNNMVKKGYNYENLPLILPLILFPSSEILVAACMYDFNKDKYRSLEAKPALKQKVYETDSIPEAIKNGKLDNALSTFLVPDSLKEIYKEIPEVRKLIQILSFGYFENNNT